MTLTPFESHVTGCGLSVMYPCLGAFPALRTGADTMSGASYPRGSRAAKRDTRYPVFSVSTDSQLIQFSKPSPLQNVLMTPLDSLQQLHNLDRASPLFHKEISEFLRGKEYRDAVPNLKGEDLMWLVEYLDSVSLQTVFPHSTFNNSTLA
jgi:hypothetical protein